MLPQRERDASAMFLFNVQCTAVGSMVRRRVCKNLCFSSKSVLVFWDSFVFFQLVLARVYRITEFQFLRQAILPSCFRWQEGLMIQKISCFQCLKIIWL